MKLSSVLTSKDKFVTVTALVSGMADGYTIPKTIQVSCQRNTLAQYCRGCSVNSNKTPIPIEADDALRFVNASDRSFARIVKDITNLPCNSFSFAAKKKQTITRIFLVDAEGADGKTHTCYFMGSGLELNSIYEFSGHVLADPKTQNTTAVFTTAKKVPSRISSFSVTKESHNKLNEFCVTPDVESVLVHLERLYSSYAANVTHIFDRYDLHLAVDLVFRSPLSFTFDGDFFHKGWSDVAIIGDTRVGKGFVAEGLQRFFGVGEVVSGDNATLTGLIGGLKSVDHSWTVQWGKFPKNDGGMLILDESSKLSRYTINHLTRIRSEGIAEIHKIQSYSAPARVRTLFIFNPANGKNISHYPYGIQSVLSVFKDPATISRLDYALVVSKDEADIDSVNKARKSVPVLYDQELERQLIYWTWSRKNEDIVFSPQAVDRCYMLALDLADKYSFDVPLIQGENIRYKLAKIAACFAARVYSTKYSGNKLFIDSVHIECAWVFLNMIYKKKASSYYAMSAIKKSLNDDNMLNGIVAIEKYFASFYGKRLKLLQVLLTNSTITMSDIADQTELPKDISLEIVSRLVKNRLIERSGFVYIKTERFTAWLRDEVSKGIGA